MNRLINIRVTDSADSDDWRQASAVVDWNLAVVAPGVVYWTLPFVDYLIQVSEAGWHHWLVSWVTVPHSAVAVVDWLLAVAVGVIVGVLDLAWTFAPGAQTSVTLAAVETSTAEFSPVVHASSADC